MNKGLLKRLLAIHSVPPYILVLTALASYAAQALGALQSWPLWAIVLVTLIPWVPIFTSEMVWTYRHYHWLALFYVLVVTQGGHFIEHVAQMIQIHILGLQGAGARGIFGALDIEWVHFIWNTWVLIAVVLLLYRFRSNPWLWLTLAIAGWHELEHAYIMSVYLTTGTQGTPGLLSKGGALGGGFPLIRPDLHFLYNLAETVPLLIGFLYQLQRTYDDWLAQAFPHIAEPLLIETTNRVQSLHFDAGETVVRQGDPSDRFYIITQGEVMVIRQQPDDREVEVATMGPGQFFGEIGLLTHTLRTASVRTKTAVEVLALDRDTFRTMVESSEATAEDLARVVSTRLARSLT